MLRCASAAFVFTGSLMASRAYADTYTNPSIVPDFNHDHEDKWNFNWDFMQTAYETKKAKLRDIDAKQVFVVRNILLIRHGQYILADEPEGKVLTELGKEQAKLTGERIKDMIGEAKLDTIHVSTMVRAQETAAIISQIFPNVPVKSTDLLCEGKPCLPVPKTSSLANVAPDELNKDSFRIEAAFRQIMHRTLDTVDKSSKGKEKGLSQLEWKQAHERFELVVCHGNVIRYFLFRVLQLDPQAWLRLSIYNCGITWVRIYSNGKVSVRMVGDVGHIPSEKISYH